MQEKRRSLFIGLFAMAIGVGMGLPLAEDVPRAVLGSPRPRGGRRGRKRRFAEFLAFVLNAGIAVGGVVVGTNSILKGLNTD